MGTHFMLHKRRQFIHSLMKVSYKISAKSRSKDDNERRRTIKETVLRLVREKYPGTTLTIDGVDKEYKKYEAKRQGHGHLRNIPDEWLALTDEEKKELQQAIRLIDEEVAKLPSINLPSPSEERRPFVRSIDGDHSNGEVNLNDEEDEDIAPDPEFDEEHWQKKEVLIELRQNDQKLHHYLNLIRQLTQTSLLHRNGSAYQISLPSSPIITVPPPLSPTMLNPRHVSVIRSTSTAF